MSKWIETELGKIIDIKHGWAFKGEFFACKGDLIVVTPGNFIEEGGFRVREGKEKFYTGDFPNEFLLKKDDLIIAMTEQGAGLLGSPALITEDNKFLHNQRIGLFQNYKSEQISKKYLYYLFFTQYVRGIISGSATGTKVKHTAPKRIYSIKIKLPPLPTQKKIAKILSNYDDLIENNLKRIKLLEESARLTYEEWFLRFRIDGVKLDIDSETGLPYGWETKKLGDCVNNFDNKRKPLSAFIREKRKGKIPYYGAASILDYIDDYIFDGKYLLLGEDGTVITKQGSPMLQFINCKFWVSNHAHILTGKLISTELLYLILNIYPISNHITGAAQPKINQQNLNRIILSIPNDLVLKKFDLIVIPIFKLIFKLQNQNQRLKEARDILLPRLMTGIIDTENMDIKL
ncbi:restriction endonuclease subunit S [Candidatus Venteria ishoeyi]|uniref:Type I restriction modification DNA specificity domain protein n=1 Tax=Candidatus Venteria ishoeyi TaxID=1899563 RepID=A0A1H6FA89_9GAMM|nr:restriction endonuclease subunit S [Candidatus Venteria ishoeyi]SEH06281.1 Type I restriction modification DNA specificity domain protein [Candidatus Venteria ishoeyi]